jgi:hypothetical protein
MNYQPIPFKDPLRKRVKYFLNTDVRYKNVPPNIRSMFFLPDYLPAIRDITTSDNKVYIQTYKIEKNRSEFFIFDFNGKLLKKVFLPQADGDIVKLNTNTTFTIHHNKYYYLVENLDEEVWELFVEEIK